MFSGASYHTCFHACLTLRFLSLNALRHIIHVHVECRLVNVPRCPLIILYLPPSVDCVLHTFLNITPKTPLNYFSSTHLSQKSVIRFALLAVDHVGRGVQSEFEPRRSRTSKAPLLCREESCAQATPLVAEELEFVSVGGRWRLRFFLQPLRIVDDCDMPRAVGREPTEF